MADNKLLGASGLYFGGNEINKAYMGSTLVWQKAGGTEIDYSKEYFYIESINGYTQVSITTYQAGYYKYIVLLQGADEYIQDLNSASLYFLYEYWDDFHSNYIITGDFTTTAKTQYNIVTLESPGDRLVILGNTEVLGSATIQNIFTLSNEINVGGNVMSLSHGLDSNNDPVDPSTLPNKEYSARIGNTSQSKQLMGLFKNQPVVDASNLVLSSPTVLQQCYYEMFRGCTSLISGPAELPATTLTNLSQRCYQSMFYGCTSLTTAPALPATTLAGNCYNQMFRSCSSLVTAPTLPATTLQLYCYSGMFRDCINLTSAPELPATTLVSNCYSQMFYGCTKLNYIKALFTTDPSGYNYLTDWVNGVSATGTFVKNSSATWNVTGNNGVPSGWTVQTASS